MTDKIKLTYKNQKLKIMLGETELPLTKIVDPAVIVLSVDEPPTLRFELVVDEMSIDEIKAIGESVSLLPKGVE